MKANTKTILTAVLAGACIDIDIQESKMANLGVHPAASLPL